MEGFNNASARSLSVDFMVKVTFDMSIDDKSDGGEEGDEDSERDNDDGTENQFSSRLLGVSGTVVSFQENMQTELTQFYCSQLVRPIEVLASAVLHTQKKIRTAELVQVRKDAKALSALIPASIMEAGREKDIELCKRLLHHALTLLLEMWPCAAKVLESWDLPTLVGCPRVFFHGTDDHSAAAIFEGGFKIGGTDVPIANGTNYGTGVYGTSRPDIAELYGDVVVVFIADACDADEISRFGEVTRFSSTASLCPVLAFRREDH